MTSEKKLAYFAGLIDGEGNVAIYKIAFPNGKRSRPVIKVDMTCKKTIDALKKQFGGYVGVKKITKTRHNLKQWRWEVTFNRAVEVAAQLVPYSITKRKELKLVAAFKTRSKRLAA